MFQVAHSGCTLQGMYCAYILAYNEAVIFIK